MTVASKVFLPIFILICLSVGIWLVQREIRVPQNQGDVLNRMIELQKQGRYDKAVSVVQTWLKNPRRDASHDGFLYGQIAFVYIAKASKRPA